MGVGKMVQPRILMVIAQFWPIVGGAEVQCQRLSKELIRRGYEVKVLTGRFDRSRPSYEEVDSIPVFHNWILGVPRLRTVTYLLSLAWELWKRRDTFDIIHVHQALRPAAIAALLAKLLNKPIVVKVGGGGDASDILFMKKGLAKDWFSMFDPLLWHFIRWSDCFIAISRNIESELRAEGFSDHQIAYIPNGVVLPCVSDRAAGSEDKPRIVTLSRFDRFKGIDTLLRAAARIQGCDFYLAGVGPLENELRALRSSLGLEGRVHFEGFVKDIHSFLARSDIFVLPSLAEGLSNALLEAMAHCLPCIATAIGGNTDVIEDGINGLLVPPGDDLALAAAIKRLIEDRELRTRLGVAAWETVRARFSIEHVAERYIELYKEILADKGTVT